MNNRRSAWNKYSTLVGTILVTISFLSMILAIPADSSFSTGLLAIRNFIAIVGPIVILVFLLSGGRERKLIKLATEFGLTYEGEPHSILAINDPQNAVLNRLSGQVNGHSILIEDRQKLIWVPLGFRGRLASRRTVIYKDQIEQKVATAIRFIRVREIKRWLINIK